jgi:hypothetical protein
MADDETFTITFSGEAWEQFYTILETYVEKQYCVTLNGEDVQLIRIENGTIWNEDAKLVVRPWNEADHDWTGEEKSIPLFEGPNAITAIYSFHCF